MSGECTAYTPDGRSFTGTPREVDAYVDGWERGYDEAMRDRDIKDAGDDIQRAAFWAIVSLAAAAVSASWVWLVVCGVWVGLLAWSFRDYRTLTLPRAED